MRTEAQHATCKGRPQRPPVPVPPDQDQRDRKKVWANDLHSRLVVLEIKKVYLLPVRGSDTQWYKNVLQNPLIRIEARGVGAAFRAASVVEKFREKYGARDAKKYYSKFGLVVVATE